MATVKFLNAAGKYRDHTAREDVISYIFQPDKTPSHMIGGMRVDLPKAAESMRMMAEYYHKDSLVRLRHFVISFSPEEIRSRQVIMNIAKELMMSIACKYQVVFAVHEDTATPHIHFVFNSISFVDGHRYRGDKSAHHHMLRLIKLVLGTHGVHTLYEIKYRPEMNSLHE